MPHKTSSEILALSQMISRLMSHYWTADDPPATREGQVEDWIQDLMEFDLNVVRDACAEWRRRNENKRPTPGQIRKICFDEQLERRAASQRALQQQQDGGTWPAWLYDIWGPASTGRIARQAALDAAQARQAASGSGKHFRFTEEELRTRAEWARMKGYRSWDDFLDAVQEGFESVIPYVEWFAANHPGGKPQPVKGFKTVGDVLKDMGVSSAPTVAITWMEPDAEGRLLPRASAYPKPHARTAPRSPLASYPEEEPF